MPFAIQTLTPANKNQNIAFKAYYQIVSTARNILCSIPSAVGHALSNTGEVLPKVDEIVILPQQVSVYAATLVPTPNPPTLPPPPTLISTAPFYNQILQANPYLYWRLGESTGTTAYDCTGNGNIGLYQGNCTLSRATSVGGDANRSVLLADTTAKITSQVAEQAVNSLSIFLRFKIIPGSDILGMFYLGDTITQPASYILSVLVSSKGILYLYTNDGNTHPANCWINSFGSVKDTQWHTLTITISNGFKKIYQDGLLKFKAAINTTFNTKNLYWTLGAGAWLTGNNNYATYLGLLDEFALFNTELSADQIYSIHQSAIASPLLTVPANAVYLTYTSDGDSNGLFYYLGSKGQTMAWSNPASNNLVAISTANSTSTSITVLLDRTGNDFYIQQNSPNFVTFNIKNSSFKLVPSEYSIRTRPNNYNHLRNWFFRASVDGMIWDILDAQVNNTTLSSPGQWLTISLTGVTEAYSYFQIYMNGVDSNGYYYLCLSEFELYGILIPITNTTTPVSVVFILNPNDTGSAITLTSNNLAIGYLGGQYCLSRTNIGKTTGKWYWEVTITSGSNLIVGIANDIAPCRLIGFDSNGCGYYGFNGNKINQTSVTYGATFGSGDIIGVAVDLDAGTIEFYKNGGSQGIVNNNILGTVFPSISGDGLATTGTATAKINFGDSTFAYSPPSGFTAYSKTPSITLDPYFNNVVLLLHMTGNDFVDVKGKPVYVNGNTKIVTNQSKFGGGSGYFDGSSSLYSPNSLDFNFDTGDFTIEFFIYPTLFPPGNAWGIMDYRPSVNASPFTISADSSGKLYWYDGNANRANNVPTTNILNLNVWQHFAITRKSQVIRTFLNGVKGYEGSCTTAWNNTGNLLIGDIVDYNYPYNGSFNGYMNELRITKNVPRYIEDFRSPTAPFPNN